MKTILVTGCAGYIGSQLTRDLLKCKYRVKGVDNFIRNNGDSLLELTDNKNFEFIYGDVLNKNILKKCLENIDYIINLIGIVGQPACDRNEKLAWLYNAEALSFLIDQNKNNIPILQSSTGSIYGKVKTGFCDEETPPLPLTIYAESKLKGEEYLKNSKNYLIYRLATLFGVSPNIRLDLLINDLTYKAVKEKSLVIFQKEFKRTFLHVKDVSLCMIHGIKNFEKMRNQIYNIGDESGNWTKEQVGNYLKEKTKCNVFFGEGYNDPDARDYSYCTDKIKKTGWQKTISIKQGIDELIKCFSLLNAKTQYDFKI